MLTINPRNVSDQCKKSYIPHNQYIRDNFSYFNTQMPLANLEIICFGGLG